MHAHVEEGQGVQYAGMANQLLTAKQKIVYEQLTIANAHLDSLLMKKEVVDKHSSRLCSIVSKKIAEMKHTLEETEKELIAKVVADSSFLKQGLDLAKTHAQGIIEKSLLALKTTEDTSTSSSLLGECLMDLLLLPHEDLCNCDAFLQSGVDINVSYLQSLIEELKLDLCSGKEPVDSKVEHGLFKSVDSSDSHNYSCELPDLHDGSHCSIQQWNPMEVDFLASKNNYAYDEEDASVAIQGYKSCKRVCRFYETPEGCRRGPDCPFLHLSEGVTDCQYKETFTRENTARALSLPSVGDWVVVIITALISATEFYIQLPLGCTHPLHFLQEDRDSDALHEPELSELIKEMTKYYSHNVFGDRDTVQPHKGEVIAAFYAPEECWYRGLVLDTMEDKIKVCYVDYGNVEWIIERNIRCIREEYMSLPFQAVHCRLAEVIINDEFKSRSKETKRVLEQLVVGKVLIAHTVAKVCGNLLYVHLFAGDGSSGIHINQALTQKGIVSRQKMMSSPCVVDDSIQPG